jgi:YidC/Oxa1 family membrane protein insertase
VDASNVPTGILSDELSFGWVGGLNPTEVNIEDDQVYFNAYAYLGGEQENLKVKEGKPEETTFNGYVDWTAIRTKYFVMAILPEDPTSIRSVSLSGTKDQDETYQTTLNFNAYKKSVFELYVGPLEYSRINNLGRDLESIMDFGWSFIRPISKAILYTLTEMHVYIPNYGFILIIFSVLIKLIVYPQTQSTTLSDEVSCCTTAYFPLLYLKSRASEI